MNQLVIPSQLAERLLEVFHDNKVSKTQQKNIYSFLSLVIRKGSITNGIFNPVPLHGKSEVIPVLSRKTYKSTLALLEAENILRINHYSKKPTFDEKNKSNKDGITKKYQLNHNLVDEFFQIIEIHIKQKGKFKASKDVAVRETLRNVKLMKLNVQRSKERLLSYIDDEEYLVNRKILFNDEVKAQKFKSITYYSQKSKTYKTLDNITKTFLIEKFGGHGREIIQVDKSFYFVNRERFYHIQKCNIVYSHIYSILSWKHKKFVAKRCDQKRLHSTFSNLAALYRPFLSKTLIEADISNSQFFFLTYLLENYNVLDNKLSNYAREFNADFSDPSSCLFFRLSKQGRLYEYIAERLLLSRDKAKNRTMYSFFNHRKIEGKLYKLFPEICCFLNAYKETNKNAYKDISRTLQQVEAEKMIDGIYKELIVEKIFCLTAHDAVFFLNKDKEIIIETIKKHLKKVTIKINKKSQQLGLQNTQSH